MEKKQGKSFSDCSVCDFIKKLMEIIPDGKGLADGEEEVHFAHLRGWAEDTDEVNADSVLERRSAARIVHCFLKVEMGIGDLEDISLAKELADLYTCRVCVNHVAQIYVRKIMEAREEEDNGKIVKLFNMLEPVSKEEAEKIIRKVKFLAKL